MSLLLQPMGMRHRRAAGIVRFSNDYLALLSSTQSTLTAPCSNDTINDVGPIQPGHAWTRDDIMGLFYCGEYAYAAYQLFIQRNWDVDPPDHALKAYAEFQRGQQQVTN
jgi:hypothetical protein